MLPQSGVFAANMNGVANNSTNGYTLGRSVKRKPLFILSQLKNAKDKKEKRRLKALLKSLKEKLPDDFRIGAAVGKGDGFFDAIAQGLNELKVEALFSNGAEEFNVGKLRKVCKQYAVQSAKGEWLDKSLKDEGTNLAEYISSVEFSKADVENPSQVELGNLKQKCTTKGRLYIEGKIISEKYGVKIKVLELAADEVENFCITRRKIGKGKNIIYLLSLQNGKHFVPLLRNIVDDIKDGTKVSWAEVYGHAKRKRRLDVEGQESIGLKKPRLHTNVVRNEDLRFSMSNGFSSALNEVVNEVPESYCCDVLHHNVTRKPLQIFSQLKKAKHAKERNKLEEILALISQKLPERFKLAAAVGNDDCFFDAVAQCLTEIGNKGLIVVNEGFNVKTLRKICRQHAMLAEKGAWLRNALKAADQKYSVYKKSIELTVEDLKCASAVEELEVDKLENVITGRLEIEGKIISENYGVKIRVLELNEDEFGDFHIARAKMGKGKHFIYLFKYENHFVPLLSNIEGDISGKMRVAKELIYGSNSRKRKLTEVKAGNCSTKKARLDSKDFDNSDLGVSNDLEVPSEKVDLCSLLEPATKQVADILTVSTNLQTQSKGLKDYTRTYRTVPHRLLKLMYHLDLSTLCLLRKSFYKEKYASLSLKFSGAGLGKFNDIIINHKEKSICIQIEYVDNYYMDNDINFGKLFTKDKRSFSLSYYFENFLKYFYTKTSNSLSNIKYLVIFTNAALELTEYIKLKRGRFRDFFAFKFEKLEKCRMLKNFLLTKNGVESRGFYQFSKDEITRAELLKRLPFSNSATNEIKSQFLDKLVFAVNQPDREELNSFIRNEIKSEKVVVGDYVTLQEEALSSIAAAKKLEPCLLFAYNLLVSFLHDMLLNELLIESINTKNNDITLNHGHGTSYVKVYHSEKSIGFSQLFPGKKLLKQKHQFSLNSCFQLYLEHMQEFKNLTYFIIWTNAGLNVSKENELKKDRSKLFYALKFHKLEALEIFKNCTAVNKDTFYRCSKEDTTKLLGFLSLPAEFPSENESKIKAEFLKKLVFSVNQPSKGSLESNIKIKESNVQYNHEELQEVATRWVESREFDCITKDICAQLLQDIKNERSSYQRFGKNIDKEIRFARAIADRIHYQDFLDYCIKGAGKKYLEILAKEGIKLSTVSTILSESAGNAFANFENLMKLWFDKEGNRTTYLKTFQNQKINLLNISCILHQTRGSAPSAFLDLYYLLFDKNGNKTKYLTTLEKEGIPLGRISSILQKAKSNAVKAFKELFDLWFDKDGNKTKYLKAVDEENISLSNFSSLLRSTGSNAAQLFREFFDLWFDSNGNKTQFLKTLQKENINLHSMSSILGGSGTHVIETFKGLYELWFDGEGNKTQYLKTLEKEGIKIRNISSILHNSGIHASIAFKELYNLCFDEHDHKTQYLKTLNEEGIGLVDLSGIVHGGGKNATKGLKDLYDVWFDEYGNKTFYLKTLENHGMNLKIISRILTGTRTYAVTAFKNLYKLLFDLGGNKTPCLKVLEINGIDIHILSSILHYSGPAITKVFEDLYDLWIDDEGNKTQYLLFLEKEGMNLGNVISILEGSGTGNNALKAFKELFETFIDEQGNIKPYLQHFILPQKGKKEKVFKLKNLFGILKKTGKNAKTAFLNFHDVCFDENGKRTKILDDFYDSGFKSSNLSAILFGTGLHAPAVLQNLHEVCFVGQDETKPTPILTDFLKLGFKPGTLCSLLSGSGRNLAKDLQKFHVFCFEAETKIYLERLLSVEAGFAPGMLSKILHGAGASICVALKEFHDVCFDEKSKDESELLLDFRRVGFMSNDLANILSMSGKNAGSTLRQFHKVCFNQNHHLTHFLDESEVFNPKTLARILHGVGINVAKIFKALHELCFDEEGNKTKYLSQLVRHKPTEVTQILYERVKDMSNHYSYAFS